MKRIIRPRNVFLALVALLVVWMVEFAYRKNNLCEQGDHPIQSEADAIAVAKKKIVKNPFFSSESFGSAPDFVDALERTENCCHAARFRNALGVIFWEVHLGAKMRPSASLYPGMPTHFSSHIAHVVMSNCGSISTSESYKDAD
jgi:hypothetical protein